MRMLARGLFVAALLTACGGSQAEPTTAGGLEEAPPPRPVGPANASGSSEATAVVGRAGGTFSLANGARLEIPQGALSEEIEVTFHDGADGQAFGDRERQRALGPMLAVEPALRTDGPPFVVSVPNQPIPNGWNAEDLAFAMEEVAEEQRAMDTLGTVTHWQFYPAAAEGSRLIARTEGLQGHRLQFGVAR
ncbi:MAG: hypothetical protein H6719_26500 [Sandaracinaceae bacterium]|nr:hypothetical protein [Sandaracinaceae bacterium]